MKTASVGRDGALVADALERVAGGLRNEQLLRFQAVGAAQEVHGPLVPLPPDGADRVRRVFRVLRLLDVRHQDVGGGRRVQLAQPVKSGFN